MQTQWMWAAGAVRWFQPCALSQVAGERWVWGGGVDRVGAWVFALAAHGACEAVEVL